MKKIVLAVGGTGGHLFPAQCLEEDLQDSEVIYIGAKLNTNTFFSSQKKRSHTISSGTFTPTGFFSILRGFFQSLFLLKKEKPDAIVGFGSYHSAPVLLAATLLRIPYVLYEPNAIAGKVTRLFARGARNIGVQFPGSIARSSPIHIPMRCQVFQKTISKTAALEKYNLSPEKTTLLILGGSQGARALNDVILRSATALATENIQLLHLIGPQNSVDKYIQAYNQANITACVLPFEPEMEYALAAADKALCRAGASTIAEIRHYNIAALLIPYPYAADDHQSANARYVEKEGGGVCLPEKELTPARLLKELRELKPKEGEIKEKISSLKELIWINLEK